MNLERLLERVKDGEPLSGSDRAEILRQLKDPDSDTYTLLHILGRANSYDDASEVWRRLNQGLDTPDDDDDNGMIRRIAVQILVHWWFRLDALPIAIDKAFTDPNPLVRSVAASGIGILGRRFPEARQQSARALLRGFLEGPEADQEVWESFYRGMLELVGVPPAWRPYRPGGLLAQDISQEVVEAVRSACA
jgi:hypothetical protein